MYISSPYCIFRTRYLLRYSGPKLLPRCSRLGCCSAEKEQITHREKSFTREPVTCESNSLFAFCLFADCSLSRLLLPRGLCMYVSLHASEMTRTKQSVRNPVAAVIVVPNVPFRKPAPKFMLSAVLSTVPY